MSNLNTIKRSDQDSQPQKRVSGEEAFEGIVEQHVTDAAFLWLMRSQVIYSSTLYNAYDIKELDQRIAGHLDALLAVKHTAWKVSIQQIELEEAGETFVNAFLAFHSGDPKRIKTVCEVALSNKDMFPGLVSALGWVNKNTAEFWIHRFLNVTDLNYQYLGITACSIRRLDPKALLTKIILSPESVKHPLLFSRCLRLIGELKRQDLIPALNQAIEHDNKIIQFWAAHSSVLLGNLAAIDILKPFVIEDSELKEIALQLVFNVLTADQARMLISEISKDLNQNKTVINATGILGDPHAVPWLMQQMNKLLYARSAGCSFSLITGLDFDVFKQDEQASLSFKELPNGEIEDEAEEDDSDIPVPDLTKVQMYWQQYGSSLNIGQRYFMGQPISQESLNKIIKNGNQLQRSSAVIKLALLDNNLPLINIALPTVIV